MRKILNLKEFLLEHGMLKRYIEQAVSNGECGNLRSAHPSDWLMQVFMYDVLVLDDVQVSRLERDWKKRLENCYGVVPGMPIGDELGLSLVLAEQEKKNGDT